MSNGGNMKQAMIEAGYSEKYADRNGKYLLGIIGEDIKKEQEQIKSNKIKSIKEIQEWWSKIIDDGNNEMRDKIKASELLAKSQGGFVDNVSITGDVGIKIVDDIE